MASYARMWDRFQEAGLQVFGIVVDDPARNLAMVEKLILPFPILSDPEGEVTKVYAVWNSGEGGIARPALFLVRPNRRVPFQYVGADFADRPTDHDLFAAAVEAKSHA